MRFFWVALLVCLLSHARASYVIGIDLGTTFSVAAVYRGGAVEIIPNDQGNRITPSWVAFTEDGQRLVGEAAKNQGILNPRNTVYDAKRLIGRRFDDPDVQKDLVSYPFKIIDKNNRPHLEVSYKGEPLELAPEEVSGMVLSYMKKISEDYLGEPVTQAVVTVPAYFNDAQRQATRDAGKLAGLEVLRILNEPTAAAVAYGLDKKGSQNVLVFDLGGGTFDVSLLTIKGNVFEVKATAGDTHLGGEDFDSRIMDHFIARFKMKHEKDLVTDNTALARLRKEVEKAKRQLSTVEKVRVEIPSLMDGIDFSETLTRAKFESLCSDLFKKTLHVLHTCFEDKKIRSDEVDEVVMVGGSSRIPKVRDLVKLYFKDKTLHTAINPDESIAHGAAVQAAMLGGNDRRLNVVLHDVTPLSLGIRTGKTMTRLIKRNTPVPTKKHKMFTTSGDNQVRVTIDVLEGERVLAKDNNKLGTFVLEGIPPGLRGKNQVKVTFEVDEDGILNVTAQHKGTGKKAEVTIDSDTRPTENDIKRMLENAEKYAMDDAEVLGSMAARDSLESYAVSLRGHMSDNTHVLGILLDSHPEEKTRLLAALTKALDVAGDDDIASKDIYEEAHQELTAVAVPLLQVLSEEWEELEAERKAQEEAASEHEEEDMPDHDEL